MPAAGGTLPCQVPGLGCHRHLPQHLNPGGQDIAEEMERCHKGGGGKKEQGWQGP